MYSHRSDSRTNSSQRSRSGADSSARADSISASLSSSVNWYQTLTNLVRIDLAILIERKRSHGVNVSRQLGGRQEFGEQAAEHDQRVVIDRGAGLEHEVHFAVAGR